MTEAQAIEAITEAFQDGWEQLHVPNPDDPDYCPIAFEGEGFDAPTTWVRFSIVHGDRGQRTMGPRGSRRVEVGGMIAVQVFVAVNIGTDLRARLCDDVRTAIELQNFSVDGDPEPLRVYAGPSRNPSTEGRWLMQNVILPFTYWTTV